MTPWSHSPPYKAEQEPEDPAKTKEIEEQKEKQRQKEQQREPKKKQKEQKKQHRHREGRLAHAPCVPGKRATRGWLRAAPGAGLATS